MLGRLPYTVHCTDDIETRPQLFCERGLLWKFGALALEVGFRFGTHLEATEMLSGSIEEDAIFALSLYLAPGHGYLLKESLYTHRKP